MTRQEVIALMTVIKATFPAYYRGSDSANEAVAIWSELLSEDNPLHITKALKDFIKTDVTGFPPTIGQIRGLAKEYRYQDFIKAQQIEELPPPKRSKEEELEQEKAKQEVMKKLGKMFK